MLLGNREADEAWKTRCLSCWKRSKAPKPRDDRDLWYRRGFEAGLAETAALQEAAPGRLDAALIRQLLQLTHPDKHGGSKLATKVTARLLDLRKEATA
ncbi:MAG: hypothetical protein ABIP08_06005 [Lautropia sp.]